jgi:hypothetical protein
MLGPPKDGRQRATTRALTGAGASGRIRAMQHARSGQAIPITPTGRRQATARRLEAARVLAGRPSLRSLATATGIGYGHLLRAANAQEPLTSTDVRDLAGVLDVPPSWLAHGWANTGPAS